ncbi:MAG: PIN domain-containing protein [Candidatus Omnitrophica bacterium]|nr:PIN domain-containing protein [Candidatus Omnitrophota bacterium]
MEEKIIIDTNIIIDYEKKKSNLLEKYLKLQEKNKIKVFISVVSVFEYYSSQLLEEKTYFSDTEILFSFFTIQEVNKKIAQLAAEINRKYKLYKKIGLGDILIAATSLYLNAPLLTKNKKHFKLIPHLKFI